MGDNIDTSNEDEIYVIAVRHGERLDYYTRDNEINGNWLIGQDHPWDPPLTDHGIEQAKKLGRYLLSNEFHTELQQLLPLISTIYTSPFLRCRQTSCNIRNGLLEQQKQLKNVSESGTVDTEEGDSSIIVPTIRYEWGLAESLNSSWYRSWSLPGSNGTWGYKVPGYGKEKYDPTELHPAATVPIQESVLQILENLATNDSELDCTSKSISTIIEPYCFATGKTESAQDQRKRMVSTLEHIVQLHSTKTTTTLTTTVPSIDTNTQTKGQTIVLVSHGGPVTHLYEALTNNPWYVHGEATYCCYSIYKLKRKNTPTTIKTDNESSHSQQPLLTTQYEWEAIRVNESS